MLPTVLGLCAYIFWQFAFVQTYLLSTRLVGLVEQAPIIEQFFHLEIDRRGQESGDRFLSITICLFISVALFVVIATAVSILKDSWRKQQGLRAVNVTFPMVAGGLASGCFCAGIFVLRFPVGDGGRKGLIIEETDFKFILYYILSIFCAISIAATIRYLYQILKSMILIVFPPSEERGR